MSSSQIGTTTANNESGSGASNTINPDSSNQRIDIDGIQIDRELIVQLLAKHLGSNLTQAKRYKFSDAFEIYLRERGVNNRKRFTATATRSFNNFIYKLDILPAN